jgi:hypothetical protein
LLSPHFRSDDEEIRAREIGENQKVGRVELQQGEVTRAHADALREVEADA